MIGMPNDIEHLKVHKIHRPDEVVRREQSWLVPGA